MILKVDHLVGGAVIAAGIIVWALSGDLPTGGLSMPGAGMMPKLVCSLMMAFGLVLIVRAKDSPPLASLSWSDLSHAVLVLALTALATLVYTRLGFIITFSLLLFGLLCIERRNLIAAAAYSIGVSVGTYLLFSIVLKSPLETGPFGF
jgi:hypothetical protein